MSVVDDLLGITPRVLPVDFAGRLCPLTATFGATLPPDLCASVNSRQKQLDAETELDLIAAPMTNIMDAWTVDEASGIYAIYWMRSPASWLVYLGSTKNLSVRLKQHRDSVVAANKLDEKDVFFRCVYRCSCHSLSAERRLIEHYRPDWNGKGFGRRPGASGDRQQPSLWDVEFGRILAVGPEARTGRKRALPNYV